MKNLFLGAILLFLFSTSVVIIQTSCSKTEAQSARPQSNSLNKILVSQYLDAGRISITIMNYDGTDVQVLNIPFPVGFDVATSQSNTALSADGTKVFFSGRDTDNPTWGIYSCDTSGANLIRIHDCTASGVAPQIGGAY